MNCAYTACNRPFTPGRVDQAYCSSKCRVYAHRRSSGRRADRGVTPRMPLGARQEPQEPLHDVPASVVQLELEPLQQAENGATEESVTPDRPDDGIRWIDRWGFVHRAPAGARIYVHTPGVEPNV
jgi:hypothetical protein